MDMSATAAVISVLGVGFLGLLGYFLQALRADIRRLDTRIDRLEVVHREELDAIREEMRALAAAHREDLGAIKETLGEIKEILASHTATLAAHSRQLERMASHGERIAALEGASR